MSDARVAHPRRAVELMFALIAALILALFAAPSAFAQIADIHSDAGPLNDVFIGDNLTCQVAHANNTSFEFYNPSTTAGHCETDVSK